MADGFELSRVRTSEDPAMSQEENKLWKESLELVVETSGTFCRAFGLRGTQG